MPPPFLVLRCYQCMVFQVHQWKKSGKFECKLCGAKQSIKRNYGMGSAKECRHHVQKLNLLQGENNEAQNISYTSSSDEEIENKSKLTNKINFKNARPFKSKWSEFVEEDAEKTPDAAPNETMFLNNTEVVLEVPKKRFKGKFQAPTKVNHEKFHGKDSCSTSDIAVHNTDKSSISVSANSGFVKGSQIASSQNSSSKSHDTKKESKKFVPPPPSKNSKWAQFVEPGTSNTIVQHSQELFAKANNKCNDDDLDNVLFMY